MSLRKKKCNLPKEVLACLPKVSPLTKRELREIVDFQARAFTRKHIIDETVLDDLKANGCTEYRDQVTTYLHDLAYITYKKQLKIK